MLLMTYNRDHCQAVFNQIRDHWSSHMSKILLIMFLLLLQFVVMVSCNNCQNKPYYKSILDLSTPLLDCLFTCLPAMARELWSYLTDHMQFVIMASGWSQEHEKDCDVPHGSILGVVWTVLFGH